MTKRQRGRPPKTEHDAFGELLWLERMMEEEADAMLRAGLRPRKVLLRAAVRLEISERSAKRLKAELTREHERLDTSIASFAAFFQRTYGDRLKKNDGTELLALESCGTD